jgi:hypothetical protein
MASQLATGACHIFGKNDSISGQFSGIQYIGTCERMPQETRSPEYEPVYNDMSGTKVPLDFAWEQETASIGVTLTRWNEKFAQFIEAKPDPTNDEGSWSVIEVGRLMALEEMAWEIWIGYTFGSALASIAAYTSLGLMPGRHYLQCLVWSPESEDRGTAAMKRNFMFYAWPFLDNKFGTFEQWNFILYDQDFTGVSSSLIS